MAEEIVVAVAVADDFVIGRVKPFNALVASKKPFHKACTSLYALLETKGFPTPITYQNVDLCISGFAMLLETWDVQDLGYNLQLFDWIWAKPKLNVVQCHCPSSVQTLLQLFSRVEELLYEYFQTEILIRVRGEFKTSERTRESFVQEKVTWMVECTDKLFGVKRRIFDWKHLHIEMPAGASNVLTETLFELTEDVASAWLEVKAAKLAVEEDLAS